MKSVTVKAKVDGYHPASGLHLKRGEKYTVSVDAVSSDVFELPKKLIKGGK